jgi:hypothetical protein
MRRVELTVDAKYDATASLGRSGSSACSAAKRICRCAADMPTFKLGSALMVMKPARQHDGRMDDS